MSSAPIPPLVYQALKAGLELASTRPWQTIPLLEIASRADISMSELYGIADKDTLSDALDGWADQAMSAEAIDLEDTPRERLFDVIMRRFELMEDHRAGVLSLMRARDRSPGRLAALLKARNTSARWALSCAGLDRGNSPDLSAKSLALAWVIGKTERAWRKDESGDFARTMATLDAELTLAEERRARFNRFAPKKSKSAAPTASDDVPPTPAETNTPEAPQAESDAE